MTTWVVDASIAAKWVLPNEPQEDEALVLRERIVGGEFKAAVPDLFWPEMANLLWKSVRRGRMVAEKAVLDLAGLQDLDIGTYESFPLCRQALVWSLALGHSPYDLIYAALAQHLSAEVVTADERFFQAVGSRLPVRWLGTF